MSRYFRFLASTTLLSFAGFAAPAAQAEIALAANDGHLALDNGVQVTKTGVPDTLAIIDLSASPPKLLAEIENVPASVIGPPFSVALTPDEGLALVTQSMKLDPADPTKQIENDSLSVVDLKAAPPRIIAKVPTGKAPAGISINRAGNLALVANRGDGSVSVFTINGKTVTPAGNLPVGNATSALGTVAITPDGKQALLGRDGDNTITLLNIDGAKVTLAGRDIRPGFRPYGIDITRDGKYAAVSNVGYSNGDLDTIALIDLAANPARVVDIAPVPLTPESLKVSPDGNLVAVVTQDGSNKPKDSPFYNEHGQLVLFRIAGGKLVRLASVPIGHWPQGAVFSADSKIILVGNMVEKNIQVLHWDGRTLTDTGALIPLKAGPAALRTAEK